MREGLRVIEEQMRFASIEAMRSVLCDFRDFYNHSRPHLALKGQTPAMVWNGQVRAMREGNVKDAVIASKRAAKNPKAARTPPGG